MEDSITDIISKRSGLPREDCNKVADELLCILHQRFYETNSDYVGEMAPHEMSNRSFFHFLGMLEQLSIKYGWDKGSAGEYLGRMPPLERWKEPREEMDEWDAKR